MKIRFELDLSLPLKTDTSVCTAYFPLPLYRFAKKVSIPFEALQLRSQGLLMWDSPTRRAKMRTKRREVLGKIRKNYGNLRKNEQSGTLSHWDCEAGYAPYLPKCNLYCKIDYMFNERSLVQSFR